MRARLSLLPPLFAATLATPASAEPACEPATEAAGVAKTAAPWRAAVARLVRSTAERGHPWSCSGGSIDLRTHDDSATLSVLRRGDAAIEREVTSPDDVVPMGQALLSLPREPVAAAPREPSPPVVAAPPPRAPRLVLGARLGPRVAGGSERLLAGAGLSAAVPLGAWSPFVWGRYDRGLGHRQTRFDELVVGAGVARALPVSSFELRFGATASAAVMQRDLPRPAGGEARIDARVGVLGAAAIPLRGAWRLVGAVDAELAPGRARERTTADTNGVAATPFPFYTLGAWLGVELSL